MISFEYIIVDGINSHYSFVELSNVIDVLYIMEAGLYSIVNTKWDTAFPTFCKMIRQKIKKKYNHAKNPLLQIEMKRT